MTPEISIALTIILFIGGLITSIIGYFLRKTMDDLNETQKNAVLIRKDLDVLTKDHDNKHSYITEKFDDLKDSIITLTNEIKCLTAKIK